MRRYVRTRTLCLACSDLIKKPSSPSTFTINYYDSLLSYSTVSDLEKNGFNNGEHHRKFTVADLISYDRQVSTRTVLISLLQYRNQAEHARDMIGVSLSEHSDQLLRIQHTGDYHTL